MLQLGLMGECVHNTLPLSIADMLTKRHKHMVIHSTSYISPRLESKPLAEKGYYGIYAREPIAAGELLVMWSGRLVETGSLDDVEPLMLSRSIQVEDHLYMIPVQTEAADFVNHSCNPNAGMSGQIGLVAMRDIARGEEICYDYAMSDGSAYDEFECHCGEPTCRHHVTGSDWMLPDLQQRYAGYFSPYIQRRIDRMIKTDAAPEHGG
jgi:uncharacterized protein